MKAINSQIDLFLKDPDRITIKSRELIDVITKTINPTSSRRMSRYRVWFR